MSALVGRSLLKGSKPLSTFCARKFVQSQSKFTQFASSQNCQISFKRFFSSDKPKDENEDYIDKNSEIQKILRELYPESEEVDKNETSRADLTGNLSLQNLKYFDADESTIIYDIEEERMRDVQQEKRVSQKEEKFRGIDLSRGVEGVFDIDVMVNILRRENCADICVVTVPPGNNSPKYVVVSTCKSKRHLTGVSDLVRKIYKLKLGPESQETTPHFEGRSNPDCGWIAVDLGNMVLHLFLQKFREMYDIESLWALGREHDELCQLELEEAELYRKPLEDLVPVENCIQTKTS